jgi:hypothetical protein
MLYTTLFNISREFKSIQKEFSSSFNDDNFKSLKIDWSKVAILGNYIQMFNSLVKEIFKINYIHLFDEEEKEYIDYEYYFSLIVEKEEEDKHIPEIELFKLMSGMILFILYETRIPKDCNLYKNIVKTCNEVKNYKYYHIHDIPISDLKINHLFLFDSDIKPIEVYNLVDSFISEYLCVNSDDNFIPEYLKQYLVMLEAIVVYDILQLGSGYGNYKIDDFEDDNDDIDEDYKEEEYFREVYLLKAIVQVIYTMANKLKKEFSNDEFYNSFVDDCNVLLAL